MRLIRHKNVATVLAALAVSAIANAQPPWVGRSGGRPRLEGAGFGVGSDEVVTNAPYSGVGVRTLRQTLSTGNVISRSTCTKVYRDSEGRTRQEITRSSANCSDMPATIIIRDPVAGVQYVIDEQNKAYRQSTFKAPPSTGGTMSRSRPAQADVQTATLTPQLVLGTGLLAQGSQTVRTIPAGKIGNAEPMTITSITYYSPDLQIVVQSSQDDPRNGQTTYQLTVNSTENPTDATLFQLPTGLTQRHRRGPGAR